MLNPEDIFNFIHCFYQFSKLITNHIIKIFHRFQFFTDGAQADAQTFLSLGAAVFEAVEPVLCIFGNEKDQQSLGEQVAGK